MSCGAAAIDQQEATQLSRRCAQCLFHMDVTRYVAARVEVVFNEPTTDAEQCAGPSEERRKLLGPDAVWWASVWCGGMEHRVTPLFCVQAQQVGAIKDGATNVGKIKQGQRERTQLRRSVGHPSSTNKTDLKRVTHGKSGHHTKQAVLENVANRTARKNKGMSAHLEGTTKTALRHRPSQHCERTDKVSRMAHEFELF